MPNDFIMAYGSEIICMRISPMWLINIFYILTWFEISTFLGLPKFFDLFVNCGNKGFFEEHIINCGLACLRAPV